MKLKITFHRNPAERTLFEKIARRFILPPHAPRSLPIGGWEKREQRLKKAFPVRFFVWDSIPDILKYNIQNPYKRLKNWIRFRTWDRYDIVVLDISKDYHDPDTRLLYANFQILQDFVEIELAACMHDEETGNTSARGFSEIFRFMKRKKLRDPARGIKHLDWEINSTTGYQSTSAQEKKVLYLWWTQWRPARLDPYVSDYFNQPGDFDLSLKALFNRPFNRELSDARTKLEQMYEAEDEEMLIRLMKVRRSLWT